MGVGVVQEGRVKRGRSWEGASERASDLADGAVSWRWHWPAALHCLLRLLFLGPGRFAFPSQSPPTCAFLSSSSRERKSRRRLADLSDAWPTVLGLAAEFHAHYYVRHACYFHGHARVLVMFLSCSRSGHGSLSSRYSSHGGSERAEVNNFDGPSRISISMCQQYCSTSKEAQIPHQSSHSFRGSGIGILLPALRHIDVALAPGKCRLHPIPGGTPKPILLHQGCGEEGKLLGS